MDDDRRRHRRIAFNLPITLVTGNARLANLATLVDLSAGGLLLMMQASCEVGRVLQIRFRWGAAVVVATGRVIRVMAMGRGTGVAVEFPATDLAYAEFLSYIERLPAGHQQLVFAEIGEAEIAIW